MVRCVSQNNQKYLKQAMQQVFSFQKTFKICISISIIVLKRRQQHPKSYDVWKHQQKFIQKDQQKKKYARNMGQVQKLEDSKIKQKYLYIFLKNNNYSYFTHPLNFTENSPPILIACNQTMRENFFHKNSNCFISIVKIVDFQKKPMRIHLFTDLKQNYQIYPFAMSFSYLTPNQQIKQNVIIISMFLQLMKKSPSCFIIDCTEQMIITMEVLQSEHIFQGQYLIKKNKLIERVQKVAEEEKINQKLKDINKTQFDIKIHLLLGNLLKNNKSQIIDSLFTTQHNKMQIQIPSQFGFYKGFGENKLQKFMEIISIINNGQFHLKMVQNTIKFIEPKLLQSDKWQIQKILYEKVYKLQEIKQIRQRVSQQIFGCFISELSKVFYCKSQLLKENVYKMCSFGQIHRVIKQNRWRCECKYSEISGIPCHHEIKCCLMENEGFIYQFDKKWIKNNSEIQFQND